MKAKPDFHKQTFLKPFHKTAEFCATCHKVSLPVELNHYKEFLRGQNHYDSFLLSGVSGNGVRSFYYPPKAKENCAACHMPLQASGDFGAKDFDGSGTAKIHNHRFPGSNTGLFSLLKDDPRYRQHADGFQKTIDMHADYLRGVAPDGSDKKLRIDIFGLKPNGDLGTGGLVAPLRPELPKLVPGKSYIVEVVVRTLGVGHHFSQGTVDSNEIWVDFRVASGGAEVARNGATASPDDTGPVDPWSNFINVHMLDRDGNRINRRNPQAIFTPLYDKQIPPGGAAVLHYRLDVPRSLPGPVEITTRLRYRKFDYEYMQLVHGGSVPPKLPIVEICEDRITLPVEGNEVPVASQSFAVDRKVIPDVVSLVLKPKGNNTAKGSAESVSRRGETRIGGTWPVVRMWELDAEELFATGDAGLIPWVPLAHTTQTPEALMKRRRDRLATVPDPSDRAGLMVVTQILAGLAFPDKRFPDLFGGPQAMIESPVLGRVDTSYASSARATTWKFETQGDHLP